MRPSKRKIDELRNVKIDRDVNMHAEGSAMIRMGNTQVLCTASVEDRVPNFLRGSGKGWVTAQYGMLPRSTSSRVEREAFRGRQGGRTQEIQRLIGRSLRSVTDFERLGERTITLDCDVLQADGGTRTAAITAGWLALADAATWLVKNQVVNLNPIVEQLAAVSVGIYRGQPILDLDYNEDREAETDMNVIMNEAGNFVEIQGTAEGHAFTQEEFDELLRLAKIGITELLQLQLDSRHTS